MLAAASFIPLCLHSLGNEAFGVLTLIWAIIGYFSLFDMGIGRALTYKLSKLRQSNNTLEIASTLKAGLLLTAASGLIGMLIVLILAPYLAGSWLKIDPSLQQDAILSFRIAAIGVLPTTLTSGIRGALEGLGHFAASNINKTILGLCMFAFPALAILLHGNHLWIITLYLVSVRMVMLLAAIKLLWNHLRINTSGIIINHLKPLLNFGAWVTVSGLVSPLMVYGDRFFVSAAVGVTELPLYAIPQEGLQRLLILPTAICGALLPQMAMLSRNELKTTYWRNYKRVGLLMFFICMLAAGLAHPALTWWISAEFAQKALPIVLILSIGIWLNSMAFIPYTLMHANGNTKLTALFHLAELGFYILALWWLTTRYGLAGAAFAWAGRAGLDLIFLHFAANKFLSVFHEKK